MKIASFNVNSINARLPIVLNWLEEQNIDIVCLQEIKCEENAFPLLEFNAAGYNAVVKGQKSYNGVAILAKEKIELISDNLLENDPQARFLEVNINNIRIISVYVPNGNPLDDTKKYKYKIDFLDALYQKMNKLKSLNSPVIVAGDLNVILEDDDVYNPENYKNNALMTPLVRNKIRAIINLGFINLLKTTPEVKYSFWDYQHKAWEKNNGMLIDYFLLNSLAADKILDFGINKNLRGFNKASDHVPIWLNLN